MKNLSEDIEQYILSLLDGEEENFVSLRRKELAQMFECVPSQINYVLRSRFTPEQGYLIESRRGEYGYIKIVKISCANPEEKIQHIDDIIGRTITFTEAHRLLETLQDREFITKRERLLIEIALRQTEETSRVRQRFIDEDTGEMLAKILKRMLFGIMTA